jgi:O-phospho-L-seryl-tRNASec:L-selenocysteinyl-tRNA synthase
MKMTSCCVSLVVQSTDKNFMVPVGGAIVASRSKDFVQLVSSCYPGRASMTPILDLFITLLSMGESGYHKLLEDRKALCNKLKTSLDSLSTQFNVKLLLSEHNSISYGLSLDEVQFNISSSEQERHTLTFLGSMLYQRSVSGCRVVDCNGKISDIGKFKFCNWGAHYSNYPCSYLTVACSIGMTETDIELFFERFKKILSKHFTHVEHSHELVSNKNITDK